MVFYIFYLVALVMLIFTLFKDRQKALRGIQKTLRALLKLLPQMSFILFLMGLILTLLSPEFISGLLGGTSGAWGISIAILAGSVSLLPSFIAFPLGAALLEQGAGVIQVGAFISSLMGIGIVTFPMEKKFFGIHFAVYRNIGCLIMTIVFVGALSLITGGFR